MTAMLSGSLVSSTSMDNKTCKVITSFYDTCVIPAGYTDTIIINVNAKECSVTQTYNKTKEVVLYIPQASSITLQFDDVDDTTDYSTLSEVTFDAWESISSGSVARITKTLASGISISDTDKINVSFSGTDTNIAAQTYHFELWITTSSGNRYLLKFGSLVIEDTRKYD